MPDVAPPYTHVIFSVYSLKQLKLFCQGRSSYAD